MHTRGHLRYVTATADALSGILTLVLGAPPARLPLLIAAWAALLLPTTLLRSLQAHRIARPCRHAQHATETAAISQGGVHSEPGSLCPSRALQR